MNHIHAAFQPDVGEFGHTLPSDPLNGNGCLNRIGCEIGGTGQSRLLLSGTPTDSADRNVLRACRSARWHRPFAVCCRWFSKCYGQFFAGRARQFRRNQLHITGCHQQLWAQPGNIHAALRALLIRRDRIGGILNKFHIHGVAGETHSAG